MGICPRDGYYSIQTNCVEIRIWFMTDSIIRIRAGFDGDFAEGSYSLVMTAWEDSMDDLMKDYRKRILPAESELTDGKDQAVIQAGSLRWWWTRSPLPSASMTRTEPCFMGILWTWPIRRIPTVAGFIPAKSHRRIVSMDSEKKAGIGIKRRNICA